MNDLAAAVASDLGAAAADVLLARYDEWQRHYHTRTHLSEAFVALTRLGHAGDEDARLALWFHDAVYDPRQADNEEQSARLAEAHLRSGSREGRDARDPALVERVTSLIRATATHRAAADDPVGVALLDADLWILASPPERFDEYCAQVRAEYGFVDAATYAQARSAILRDLIDRPSIYGTPEADAAWTPAARANVERELARLT